MTDRSLYVQGKKVGTTNVSVYDQSMMLVGVLDVEVALDERNLQEKIEMTTGTRGIRVSSSNGQVVLSGQATDAVAADRALAVAKALSPNGVINAMNIAPSQQVLLEVRFLEASRDAGRQLGVNWFGGVLRLVQNGYLYSYAFWMMIGLALLLGWFLAHANG